MTHDQELQFSSSLTALLPYTKGYARTLLGHRQHHHSLYEDFAQTAVLKAWENRHRFVPGSNLKAWLFAILRNTVISHHRRHWREVVTDRAANPNVPDETANPERSAEISKAFDRFALLKEDQQQLLMDLAWHGRSYSQTAKARAIAAGTVKSRVARARRLLTALGERDELRYGHPVSIRNRVPHTATSAA